MKKLKIKWMDGVVDEYYYDDYTMHEGFMLVFSANITYGFPLYQIRAIEFNI